MTDTNRNQNSGSRPAVSVIINCFNESAVLRETLDSVFAQTFDDWEIVFWDNASTDGSWEIAESYGEKIRCFRSETTLRLGEARKRAYDETRGSYVAILDADDLWLPEKLEQHVKLFESDPELGMTYCDTTFFDQNGDRSRLFKLTNPYRGDIFGRLITKNLICSSAMMFRKDSVDQLERGFDDRLYRAQDYDLSLRMAYRFPVDYVDSPLTKWRINGVFEKPWKKSLVSRSEEVKATMDNILDMHPEIVTDYPRELRAFYKELDYGLGISAWQQGNRAESRKFLSKHLTNKKFLGVYLCTFLMSSGFFYGSINGFRRLALKRT